LDRKERERETEGCEREESGDRLVEPQKKERKERPDRGQIETKKNRRQRNENR